MSKKRMERHHATSYVHAGSMSKKTVEMAGTSGNPADFFQHPAPLGSNLYDRDRPRVAPPQGRQNPTQLVKPVPEAAAPSSSHAQV